MAGPHTLAETENAVQSRLAGLTLDYEAMAVASNLFRAANSVRNHLERTVLQPHDLTWTAFVVLWVTWIWEPIETRQIAEEGGYSAIQGTKPQSLAYGMHDSPVATLAWLVEKHRGWIDGQDLAAVFTAEQLLTNASIYWFTGTFRSASHWYWEHRTEPPAAMRPVRVDVPTGVIRYPAEVMRTPRSAVARKYELVHWTDRPTGGHFPAYEDTDALAADIHAFASAVS